MYFVWEIYFSSEMYFSWEIYFEWEIQGVLYTLTEKDVLREKDWERYFELQPGKFILSKTQSDSQSEHADQMSNLLYSDKNTFIWLPQLVKVGMLYSGKEPPQPSFYEMKLRSPSPSSCCLTSILVIGTPFVIVEIWIFCCDILSLRHLKVKHAQTTDG